VYLSIFNFKESGESVMLKKRSENYIFIAVKAAAFVLVFLMLFQIATYIFRTKRFAFSVGPIYDLPKDSIDVLLLGSSHMNTAISPLDLWHEYGITAFNAAIGDQTLPATYFELRELLKVQRPKVIVLEAFYIHKPNMMTSSGEERLHWLVDNVPASPGISEAIQTLIQKDDKTEYYLNFYTFHNRWQELTKEDFQPVESYNLGADIDLYAEHTALEAPEIIRQDEIMEPPSLPQEYLHKIIALCRDENIPLVLMASPFSASADMQAQLNFVNQVADEEDIPYLNFLYLLNDVNFDFTQDMAEWSHMNYFGVQKVTSYLGRYLQENYHLPDGRNSEEISAFWNEQYDIFEKVLCNQLLKTADSFESYCDYLDHNDYIVMWHGYSESPLVETQIQKIFSIYGLSAKIPEQAHYYCGLTRSGRFLYEKASEEKIEHERMSDDVLFSFGPGIAESKNQIGVHAGRYEYSKGNKDLNVVVYDPFLGEVVDSVNIGLSDMAIKR